uniref:Uncharacterized protein n=1 Tax=viral metagenome TaxID=1070528 RepID=A0A6M3L7R0_9ZZZZ
MEDLLKESPDFTICQALRDLYWIAEQARAMLPNLMIHDRLDLIQNRARVSITMAKAMTAKLEEYRARDAKRKPYIEWDPNPLFPKPEEDTGHIRTP